VPESVQSVIQSRVDRLAPELKEVLQRASVVGRFFRPRLLEALQQGERQGSQLQPASALADGSPPGPLRHALWELAEQGLIYQERSVPEEEYAFQHVLTQETIYASLTEAGRALLHRQVGEAIECLDAEGLDAQYERLAYHFERSHADEKALEYLLKAGEKARRAYLNEAAIGYFQRALDRLEGGMHGEPIDRRSSRSADHARLEALTGLARLYQNVGRMAEAEACFRHALSLTEGVGLSMSARARLYYGLGELLRGGSEEILRPAEEALCLLGEDAETVEAALLLDLVAIGSQFLGRQQRWQALCARTARFLHRLPYSEELRSVYLHLARWAIGEKDLERITRLVEDLACKSTQHHDLRGLASARYQAAELRRQTGDSKAAVTLHQQALELFRRAGDAARESQTLHLLSGTALDLGDLAGAAEYAGQMLRQAERLANHSRIGWAYSRLAVVARCRGDRNQAQDAAGKALEYLGREEQWLHWDAVIRLAPLLTAEGDAARALRLLQEVAPRLRPATTQLDSTYRFHRALVHFLCQIEQAETDPESFAAFCRRIREAQPELDPGAFRQWFLEPVERSHFSPHSARSSLHSGGWRWEDPFGDGSLTIDRGLLLQAANERNLELLNRSAPRLLWPTTGTFAAEAVCGPETPEKPAIGGLLLWKDEANYLRLLHGTHGPHEIAFQGCIRNEDVIVGRGRLPGERHWLRLSRIGDQVSAFCSADGERWFTVGSVGFAVRDPLEVGVHAIGQIHRSYYPGAYREGTAIRFELFEFTEADRSSEG
jgi:tetratricopeptide (TPR) repeat protein